MIKIFNKKKKEKLYLILDDFLKQVPLNTSLNAEKSRKNLEENLVELACYGHHSSNGLLFSEKGYFLTAKHCIEDLKGLKAKLYNGRTYKIKKVCAVSHKSDIAIGKINLSKKYQPKKFKIYNTDKLKKIPVVLLTRKEGKIQEKYGLIERNWNPGRFDAINQFSSTFISKPGDSGGIIISPNGELIGIDKGHGIYGSSSIKINRILDLIEFYKNQNS